MQWPCGNGRGQPATEACRGRSRAWSDQQFPACMPRNPPDGAETAHTITGVTVALERTGGPAGPGSDGHAIQPARTRQRGPRSSAPTSEGARHNPAGRPPAPISAAKATRLGSATRHRARTSPGAASPSGPNPGPNPAPTPAPVPARTPAPRVNPSGTGPSLGCPRQAGEQSRPTGAQPGGASWRDRRAAFGRSSTGPGMPGAAPGRSH